MFAYGQTGSGKTFAMGTMGRQLSTSGESDGIISRSMRFVFDRMKDIRQQYDVSLKVKRAAQSCACWLSNWGLITDPLRLRF